MRPRWGILGTGWIAGQFAGDLVRDGGCLVAVGSRSTEAATAFAERFGGPRAHGSYEELCADDAVDAIYVATPNPFHREHALLALRAGKHVLLEKPFAMNASEAREIIAVAAQERRAVMEAMWTRFLPHMVRMRQILAAGVIGEVRVLEVDLSQSFPFDPRSRFYDPALGGGVLLDLGVYAISLAVDVLGAPVGSVAAIEPAANGIDQRASIILTHGGGRQSVLQVGMDGAGPMTATVIGSRGRIAIQRAWHRPSTLLVFDADDSEIERFSAPVSGRGMQYEAAAFEHVITHDLRIDATMSHDDTVAVLGVVDEIRARFAPGAVATGVAPSEVVA